MFNKALKFFVLLFFLKKQVFKKLKYHLDQSSNYIFSNHGYVICSQKTTIKQWFAKVHIESITIMYVINNFSTKWRNWVDFVAKCWDWNYFLEIHFNWLFNKNTYLFLIGQNMLRLGTKFWKNILKIFIHQTEKSSYK